MTFGPESERVRRVEVRASVGLLGGWAWKIVLLGSSDEELFASRPNQDRPLVLRRAAAIASQVGVALDDREANDAGLLSWRADPGT